MKVRVRDRDIGSFFLRYLKEHPYFRVKTVAREFKKQKRSERSGYHTPKGVHNKKELDLEKRKVGHIIGSFLTNASRKGVIEKGQQNKARKSTPQLIEFMTELMSTAY